MVVIELGSTADSKQLDEHLSTWFNLLNKTLLYSHWSLSSETVAGSTYDRCPVHIDICVHTLAVNVHVVISYVGPVAHTDMDKHKESSSRW